MTSLSTLLQHVDKCSFQFPNPIEVDPNAYGVVAMGGDLSPVTLLSAYSQGLFPWFSDDEPIQWWSPDPRCVLIPNEYKPSKSLKKQVNKSDWITTVNTDFEQVIFNCSLPRSYSDETWITEDMQSAYLQLHDMGFAHSIEVWNCDKSKLIGGLYGLKIGGIFCGESMFHKETNASKVAFWRLCQLSDQSCVELIDCQLPNDHLISLGAEIMPRQLFLNTLPKLITNKSISWKNLPEHSVTNLLGL